MPKQKKLIKEINKSTQDWMANVYVVQKLPPQISSYGRPQHQKFILADEEGTKVQAIAYAENVDVFNQILLENHVYTISHAFVGDLLRHHQIIESPFQWTLNKRTFVKKVPEGVKFEFVDDVVYRHLNTLHQFIHSSQSVDVVAIALQIEVPRIIRTRRGDLVTVQEITLIDDSMLPIVLTMWDDVSVKYGQMISSAISSKPIIIGRHLKVDLYGGISLSTRRSTTIDLAIDNPRANYLQAWLQRNCTNVDNLLDDDAPLLPLIIPRMEESTIETTRIVQIPRTSTVKTIYFVRAKIFINKMMQPHWYMSCSECKKSTDAEYKEQFICLYCNKDSCIGLPRRKIEVQLEDVSGLIEAVAFDFPARLLLQQTAHSIMKMHEQGKVLDPTSTSELLNKDKESIISIVVQPQEKRTTLPTKYTIFSISPCSQESCSSIVSQSHTSFTESSASSTRPTSIEEESSYSQKGKEIVTFEETGEIFMHTPMKRESSLVTDESKKMQKCGGSSI